MDTLLKKVINLRPIRSLIVKENHIGSVVNEFLSYTIMDKHPTTFTPHYLQVTKSRLLQTDL